jgi:hypothetical protein
MRLLHTPFALLKRTLLIVVEACCLAGGWLALDRHILRGIGASRSIGFEPIHQLAQLVVQVSDAVDDRLLQVVHGLALASLREHLATALLGLLNARVALQRLEGGLDLSRHFVNTADKIALKLLGLLTLDRGTKRCFELLTHLA